jgi:hypothetical protein
VCPPLPHQNVLEGHHTMEALHREKALLGHCASAAARNASIRELLLQNKFTLIKIENNNSYCENIKHTLKSLINNYGHLFLFF